MSATLTIASAARLLDEHHLLREIIHDGRWTLDAEQVPGAHEAIPAITYDTRTVTPGSLLFVKGRFRDEFLDGIDGRGLAAYVAEADHSDRTRAVGLIVDDAHQAMSLLSAEFYGRPQDRLTVVGITGTKGKTTTAYLAHAILNDYSDGHAALFSSEQTCLDGHTYVQSKLTTPESLDAFRMMRQAVDQGMRYLVMEVSSQAYKVHRVHGLTFDVGAFLNISPDHISPIEHPTFEDYFRCKRQIVRNSRTLVLGADCAHRGLIEQDAAAAGVDVSLFDFRPDGAADADGTGAAAAGDRRALVETRIDPGNPAGFRMAVDGRDLGSFELTMPGAFNIVNAAAAVAIAVRAGVPADDPAVRAIERVQVPGRMERIVGGDNLLVYVDFAHNYLSCKTLVDEIVRVYGARNPRITLVAGSTGGKAIDRREGIVRGALGRAESFYFTLDDPNFEDPREIAEQMRSYVTDPNAETHVIVPRERAIEAAIADARAHADRFNIVLLIGKGHELRNIIDGRPVPYEGDAVIARRALGVAG
ncbi:UDP-N-acetylmuramoyl-L-alanyl-D-glutamate--2,6-diaminopimelate ligase [Bifidobacterium phasiani]|uniref:UDP-N-acetylmuramoyl-L-alanyl-D-glutamate--2, 6-diaminopimelate ligase n=1 Tax=Bifidobacterium phasiani TaxID=2834431 RepID=UPI001F3835B7|nr:UDP-N-acetylmuramoyl-L-alanyl-D-glutamate--2,6-diaminopimelate ligase [Bifidobacterium phasiani]